MRGSVLAMIALTLPTAAGAEPSHDFELYDLADRLVRLARVRQSARLVLVDFFSETCRPCRAALPSLKRLHSRFAARGLALVIVAVPGDTDDRTEARRITERIFAEEAIPVPVVWDKYRRVAAQYGVARAGTLRVPQAFLLSSSGAMVRKASAATALEAEISRRLR